MFRFRFCPSKNLVAATEQSELAVTIRKQIGLLSVTENGRTEVKNVTKTAVATYPNQR